jgi:flagellar basal-body rod modification protein FlgD
MNVSGTSSTQNTATSSTAKSNSASVGLNADSFLQIFTTQIANQNPMEPMDSADFLNQFAQITSVQSLSELKQTLTSFSGSMNSMVAGNQLSQATNLLGHTIEYTDANGQTQSGSVDSVQVMPSGSPQLMVGGTPVDLSVVRKVLNPAA